MVLNFFKYQGTGNDFVILDNRNGQIHLTRDQVAFLCDRRFGIGADGLMLLNSHPDYDFEMKYYNADGGESTMCGNGGRCLVKFAADSGIDRAEYRFIAIDGEHLARIDDKGNVALKMNDVSAVQNEQDHFILNTGSPHYVDLVQDVMKLDVVKKGREVRYSDKFSKEGINVNFVEKTATPGDIIVRTYERGVEDETFSCGTGVTAAALVYQPNQEGLNKVNVQTKGGNLRVEFEKTENGFQNIWLIGPAVKVYTGNVEVN
ncbi:MAG TPA: diaminopimelate epimerase [Flavisolibacter sp.]|jgi:diaminopimelate epimerase|nr:diaminopimelate epimerase [Flavisolibacter sp.]